MQKKNIATAAVFLGAVIFFTLPALSHDEGKAEQILKNGKILFASKTNHEHIFTVVYSNRVWACSVKTIGDWIGEGVGGVVCHSNGVDAEKFETLQHEQHD
ncbi:MAG: hypothetical protein CMD67_01525 [Gammaproteobacteria bacterium]|jgi:hypothetical protein|nr:hypothetical protein [Gammaproteobacteria bacterium]|tara:strand:- start:918 stop:1220 length:303 start_codon:yes stop_codon:yes gene_type:complete